VKLAQSTNDPDNPNDFILCVDAHYVSGPPTSIGQTVLLEPVVTFGDTVGEIETKLIADAITQATALGFSLAETDIVLNRLTRSLTSMAQTDTYTATGSGVTIDASNIPVKSFSVQVTGVGATATAWDVRLEGSLNNTNFSQILQHTNVQGNGEVVYSGASTAPSRYFRSRCAGLALGVATAIDVSIIGLE
jgi:hypothetical protein